MFPNPVKCVLFIHAFSTMWFNRIKLMMMMMMMTTATTMTTTMVVMMVMVDMKLFSLCQTKCLLVSNDTNEKVNVNI